MPRFCANLTMLFTELPFLERFGAARSAGFEAVEVLFPYDHPAPDILDMLVRNGLALALINCPPPNYTGGARGFAAVPGAEARFRQDFRRTLRYARALRAERINVMAGVAAGEAARDTLLGNLRWAVAEAPDQALTLEPLNTEDVPGSFLCDYLEGRDIVTAVGAPSLSLQFDTYHVARIHGDVRAVWGQVRGGVGHVQVAQAPDRSEPAGNGFDFAAFLAGLDAEGYAGWVSGEYTPKGRTEDGLSWMTVPA